MTHSMGAILDGAIAMLDEGGEPGLTLRGLAARLGGGVGSLYWYVKGKDELVDRATDHLAGLTLDRVDAVLRRRRAVRADPVASLRLLAMSLFDVLEQHSWMAHCLMRDPDLQLNTLRYWDRIGQEVTRLGLSQEECFHGTTAIVNYVVGVAAQMSYQGPTSEHATRAEFIRATTRRWSALPEADFPFVHASLGTFAGHDDRDQVTFGLDLILAGLAGRAPR